MLFVLLLTALDPSFTSCPPAFKDNAAIDQTLANPAWERVVFDCARSSVTIVAQNTAIEREWAPCRSESCPSDGRAAALVASEMLKTAPIVIKPKLKLADWVRSSFATGITFTSLGGASLITGIIYLASLGTSRDFLVAGTVLAVAGAVFAGSGIAMLTVSMNEKRRVQLSITPTIGGVSAFGTF